MQIRRNITANAFSQLWVTLVGIIFVPVYINYIGIESYGLIGIYAVLQTWLSLLDMGLSPAITREMARKTNEPKYKKYLLDLLRSIEVLLAGIAILIVLLFFLLSDWLATDWINVSILDFKTVTTSLILMGVVIGLRLIENVYRSSLIGLEKQVSLGLISSVIATIRAVGAIVVLAFVSNSVVTYFYWQVIASIISLFSLGIWTYRSLSFKGISGNFELKTLKSVWKFGAGLSLITLLGMALSQVDKIILSKILTLKEFGYYSLAYLVASGGRIVIQPIYQAVYPKLTVLVQQNNQLNLAATYHKSNQLSSVLLGSSGIFIAIFADTILTLWTQNQDLSEQVAPVLRLLVCGMVANGMMNGPYYLQLASGWTSLLVKINLLLLIFFVPVIYFLTINYGIQGAALAWLILNIIYLVIVANLMHRRLLPNEMWKWYVDDLFKPMFLPIIVGLAINAFIPAAHSLASQFILMIVSAFIILFLSITSAPLVRCEFYKIYKSIKR
jgi:O-antigen/teichoic acid export membrane protein